MSKSTKVKRVAVYVRVSTHDQADANTEENQIDKIKQYVEMRDELEFAGEKHRYVDKAVSGTIDIYERPEMRRLFEDARGGSQMGDKMFDTVVVYRLDRFARSLMLLLDIIQRLQAYKVDFISTQEMIDTGTPFGNAMVGIMGTFAELERELIKERTQAGISRSEKNGRRRQTVYGYDRDKKTCRPSINEKQAKVVKDMFKMFVSKNMSVSKIVEELESRGEKNPRASNPSNTKIKNSYKWQDKTVRGMLQNEVYIGNYYYGKTTTQIDLETGKKVQIAVPKDNWRLINPKHKHKGIIGKETFKAAQERFERMQDYGNHSTHDGLGYLLSGFLKCDHCKEHRTRGMVHRRGTRSGKTSEYYICGGKGKKFKGEYQCPCMPLQREGLELMVLHHIKQLLNNPELVRRYIDSTDYNTRRTEQLEDNIQNANHKLVELDLQKSRWFELRVEGKIDIIERNRRENKADKDMQKWKKLLQESKQKERMYQEQRKYKKGFKALNQLLGQKVEDFFKDKEKTHVLLSQVVKEIIIYSRPKRKTDPNLGGPKKEGQYVPYHMKIVFNLPNVMLRGFIDGHRGDEGDETATPLSDGPTGPIDTGNGGGKGNNGEVTYQGIYKKQGKGQKGSSKGASNKLKNVSIKGKENHLHKESISQFIQFVLNTISIFKTPRSILYKSSILGQI